MCARPQGHAHTIHNRNMTTAERVAALWALYEQLDALITPDEIETYGGCLHHLGDLISDLELELEQ